MLTVLHHCRLKESVTNKESHVLLSPTAKGKKQHYGELLMICFLLGTVPASPSKNEVLQLQPVSMCCIVMVVSLQELPAALHCSSTSYDAVQYSPVAHYQPLHTVTTDYTSVYTTPTGRRGPPSVEVEGKMYSIVDPIKRETDTNYDTVTVVTEPYYM